MLVWLRGLLRARARRAAGHDARSEPFLQAWEAKNGAGCNELGVLHERGQGVRRSEAAAASFFQQACKLGERSGCQNLDAIASGE